jgi:hypothetical protein
MESDKVELSMQWKEHIVGVTKAFIPTHLHIAFTTTSSSNISLHSVPPPSCVWLEVIQHQWLHAFILTET